MPRAIIDDNKRMNLRVSSDAKARLARAAALRNTDLTNFIMQSALREADTVIRQADVIAVSERDHRRILALLDDPPPPNAKLLAAAEALPKRR